MNSYISILLLNYNGKQFNQACIESILVQTYQHFEILFIDNASTDGSVAEVEQLFAKEIKNGKIRVIKNKNNEGFANGNNIGHQLASPQSKYICLLNNDTTVEKNWLEKLIEVIAKDKTLGAVGSIILDAGYEKQLQQMIVQGKINNLTVLGEYSIKQIESIYPYCKTTTLSGCCLLYNKSIVNIPFPERYFAYAEDIFLSFSLLVAGYKMALCPQSVVHHYGSGSFGKTPSDFKLFYGNRNQIVNFLIFYKVKTIIKLFPLFLLTQGGHLFINAPQKRFKAKLKARGRIITHRDKVQKLRRCVQRERKLTDSELLKILSKDMSSPEMYYGTFSSRQQKIIVEMNNFFHRYCQLVGIK